MTRRTAGFALTAALWLLVMPFWPLWLLFSELCDWADRRGQRRFAAAVASHERSERQR